MKNEGLTSSRLAEMLEIQPSGISHIISGRNKPSFDLLQKILRRFPRINPDWLLLDAPNIYRDELDAPLSSRGEVSDFGEFDLFAAAASDRPVEGSNIGSNLDGSQYPFDGLISGVERAKNSDEKGAKFQSQATPQNRGFSPSVERIIVLYSDHTFTTYEMR
ncbi:MAG: helix-turn-helix transcriptional regulator [Rikenellaceae bacterium]